MKNIIPLTALVCIATNGAYAAECTITDVCASWATEIGSSENCAATSETCYQGGAYTYKVINCTLCDIGGTKTSNTSVLSGCNATQVEYDTCVGNGGGSTLPSGNCPDKCPSTSWTSAGTGYQVQCVSGTLAGRCNYRCAAGYYGTASGTSTGTTEPTGCTACPTYTVPNTSGVGGSTLTRTGTSAAGTTSVTGCYIPLGTEFSDSTGSGTYTSNCNYSE